MYQMKNTRLNKKNMKKTSYCRLIAALFFIGLANTGYSQLLLGSVGKNIHDFAGLSGGIGYDFRLGKHFGMITLINYEYNVGKNDLTLGRDLKFQYEAVSLSSLINYKFFTKAKEASYFFVFVGPELTCGTKSFAIEYDYSHPATQEFKQDLFSEVITAPIYGTIGTSFSPLHRMDIRGSLGLGYNDRFIIVCVKYDHGITPIYRSPNGKLTYDNCIRLFVGLNLNYAIKQKKDKKDF